MISNERLICFYTISDKVIINVNQTNIEIINELKSKLKFNINCFEFFYLGKKLDLNEVDYTQIISDIFYKFKPIII